MAYYTYQLNCYYECHFSVCTFFNFLFVLFSTESLTVVYESLFIAVSFFEFRNCHTFSANKSLAKITKSALFSNNLFISDATVPTPAIFELLQLLTAGSGFSKQRLKGKIPPRSSILNSVKQLMRSTQNA